MISNKFLLDITDELTHYEMAISNFIQTSNLSEENGRHLPLEAVTAT